MDQSTSGLAEAAERELLDAGCSGVLIWDGRGRILHTNLPQVPPSELSQLAASFGDRDEAILRGLTLCGRRYEIHRHHPPLVYGRAAADCEPETSTGIAAVRVEGAAAPPRFALVTYEMPQLSAKMVPLLADFAARHMVQGAAPAAEASG